MVISRNILSFTMEFHHVCAAVLIEKVTSIYLIYSIDIFSVAIIYSILDPNSNIFTELKTNQKNNSKYVYLYFTVVFVLRRKTIWNNTETDVLILQQSSYLLFGCYTKQINKKWWVIYVDTNLFKQNSYYENMYSLLKALNFDLWNKNINCTKIILYFLVNNYNRW